MALKFIPAKGIELSLEEYTKLRAFQGGGWFWDHESQQVIRDCLGEFLPRVEEHSDPNGALFQHFAGGGEVASKSRAVGQQMDRVPKSQLDRLQRAVEALKRKTLDTQTDPNARQIIERFKLPDPAKDPELYRLYGSPWNRRLLVLWGCERESGTSLTPFSALSKMPVEPVSATWLRRLPLLLGLLLLLLLLAALLFVILPKRHDTDPVPVAQFTPAQNSEIPPALGPNNAPAEAGQPGQRAASASPKEGSQSIGATSRKADAENSTAFTAPTAAVQSAPPGRGLTAASPSPSTVRPTTGKSEQIRSAAQDALGSDRNTTAGATASSSPLPSASDSPMQNRASQKPGVLPSPIRDHSPPKLDDPETLAAGKPSPSTSDTPASSRASALAPDPSTISTLGGATPSTRSSPSVVASGPPKLEIINAKNSTSPKDGKVDALLVLTARSNDGTSQPVKIVRWSIDGVPQVDSGKKLVTANELSASLTPGKHVVSVTATSTSGEPLESESEMDVQIRTQSDVKLKPTGKK